MMKPELTQAITLSQVFEFLREGRRTIFWCAAICFVLSIVWIWIAPRTYESVAVLAPVSNGSMSMTQQTALRNLAGLTRGGAGGSLETPPFEQYQQLLSSVRVAEILNKTHPEVMQTLFRGAWNDQAKRWERPKGASAMAVRTVKAMLGLPAWQPPGPDTLAAYLAANLKIASNPQNGLLTVSYRSGDPVFAAHLIAWTCQAADDVLRSSARVRTNSRIRYLAKVLPNVTFAAQRDALIEILSVQQQRSMIVEADPTYVADVLIQPYPNRRPVSPKPSLVLLAGLLAGILVGIAVHFLDGKMNLRVHRALPSFGGIARVMGLAVGGRAKT